MNSITPTSATSLSEFAMKSSFAARAYEKMENDPKKRADLLLDTSPMENKRVWIGERDPVLIEKNNLVNILKLVIKEVLDSSLRFGHQLDSDHIPLQHFFIVLEHILKHGLKAKKGLLGPRKELWDLLQLVEKKDHEAVDITASVRELPTVKTPLGRGRAWLRLALMQKKLADYFRHLVDQGDEVLSEFYEPRALLRSEEAAIVTGLLLGLNIVDCNLCVKEEDLESQQGVIDFSLYLRGSKEASNGGTSNLAEEMANAAATTSTGPDITAVLDQKNYIEELNRHLNSTVSNMQAKIEGLTTTNALMKEDLSICRNALAKTQEENRKLLSQVDKGDSSSLKSSSSSSFLRGVSASNTNSSSKSDEVSSTANTTLQQKLSVEVRRREELQKELGLQKSMKAEMEMAMKLLEKDVHEKQDTIISLRDQLEDIKCINLEMYTKLQEIEKMQKYKNDLIAKLEGKSSAMNDTLRKLDDKYVKVDIEKKTALNSLTTLRESLLTTEQKMCQLEADLKIEREWRTRLQTLSEADKEALYQQKVEMTRLQTKANEYDQLQISYHELQGQTESDGRTISELADHLSKAKLQIDGLKEELKSHNQLGSWLEDAQVGQCPICAKDFGLARRKHHCRHCGGIFCDPCSDNKFTLASSKSPVRVCDNCYLILLNKN